MTKYRTKYKDVPVEADWYTYEVDRWVFSRTIDTSGRDQNPIWGKVNLAPNEREAGRSEKYTAYFTTIDKKKEYNPLDLDLANWQALKVGRPVKAQINVWGVLLRLGEK